MFGLNYMQEIIFGSSDVLDLPIEFEMADEPLISYVSGGETYWAWLTGEEKPYDGWNMPTGMYYEVQRLGSQITRWIHESQIVGGY